MSELKPIHVLILLLVSLVTGLLLGSTVWVLFALLDYSRPWWYGAGATVITISVTWIVLLKRSIRIIEDILDVDLDRDGYIGEPEQPRVIIMDESDHGTTTGIILDDIPHGEMRFARLAAGVLNENIPFAERYWTGDGKPYSQKEFRDLRDYLLLRGCMQWVNEYNHQQGIEILAPGRALIRDYASLVDNHLPIKVDNWPAGVVRSSNSRTHAARTHENKEVGQNE